ncbi:MAG: PstS family phosphate ABC transporter substrate-binding protein [Deltaproteobacteria bacterium]|nr:PstS family phosphate ABC transporter substrate-binding protein [Deltaproteobacteria bacterium]
MLYFRNRLFFSILLIVFVGAPMAGAEMIRVDPSIPDYAKTGMLAGTLNSVGSDTMNNLMTLWAERFKKLYPAVTIQVEGKGSSTAPPALIAGTAQLGPMSRDIKAEEVNAFEKKYGFKPTLLRIALDGLAVYVNKDNPLQQISLDEIDAIYSKARKRGFSEGLEKWGQLGLTGDWPARSINLYGRNSASGTYGFFKESALAKGDFKDRVKEQPGSASVVQGVAEDRYAVGYSGIGYKTSGVKALKLSAKKGGGAYEPSYQNVLNGKYPLSRYLNLYIVKDPKKPLSPLVGEFVRFILSRPGQGVVIKDGYLPLSAEVVASELAKLGEKTDSKAQK